VTSRRPSPRARTVGRSAALVAVVLAGLFVAFRHIGQQTLYPDELTYLSAAWDYVHGTFTANLEHPPTAKYLYGIAQLVLGPGGLAPRLVATSAAFGTGVVLFLWLRRPVGFWAALAAAGLWWLTPRGDKPTWGDVASGAAARIDRLALLEPVMVFFAVLALALTWRWAVGPARSGRRTLDPASGGSTAARAFAGWPWMALAGAAFALSVTSKVSTAVLLVAIAAVPVLFRQWWRLLAGGVVAAVTFAVVFVVVYVPVGGVRAIQYMLDFQDEHNLKGHVTQVLGRDYQHSPWWANFVYLQQGIGWTMLVVVVLGITCAVVIRPDRLVAVLGIALGSLIVFYCTVGVALPHYYDAWMPFALALAAIGYVRLARVRPPVTAVLAGVLVAATVVPAAQLAVAVEQARPAGLAALQPALARHDAADARVLFARLNRPAFAVYFLSDRGFMQYVDSGQYRVVVEGTDDRFPMTPALRTFLTEHRSEFDSFRVDDLRVWVMRDGRSFTMTKTGPVEG
jgi:4-amino-4-deoxy-L-arabinose transferase-like glycosyltransferase